MTSVMITALVASWIAILVLTIMVFALARQVGLLHERISPAGALSVGKGPAPGDKAPEFKLTTMSGNDVAIGGDASPTQATLLFFLSTTCPVCATLVPILRSLAKTESKSLRIIIASDGDDDHKKFIQEKGLDIFPYVVSTELGMAYGIGKLPYGVLIDEAGIISADGLCNTREHIESLLEARTRGVSSIQDYIKAGQDQDQNENKGAA